MANIILPQVSILNEINDSTNLMVEQNGEINRYPISNLDIGGGDVTINLDSNTGVGTAANINATTLGGYAANDYVRHDDNKFLFLKPKAGFIYPLATDTIPEGFLLCDGAEYLRSEYPELFAAIGTMYGNGDGSTTFNVPDLATRVPVGTGSGYALGATGGEAAHTLTINEMPNHAHIENYWGTKLTTTNAVSGTGIVDTLNPGNDKTSYEGGNQPHNNMQPYTVVNYIIATGKNTGVSVQDIITGAQALPLGIEYGGTGATNIEEARKNLGSISKELIWKNGSPTSTFDAHTETVPDYGNDEVEIWFRCFASGCIHTVRGRVGDRLNPSMSTEQNGDADGPMLVSKRHVFLDSSTQIRFGTCYFWASNGANTWIKVVDQMVPLEIYRIKGVS